MTSLGCGRVVHKRGGNALMEAAGTGLIKVVQAIIAKKPDVNTQVKGDRDAAIYRGHI
jgi:hypothetical protein